MNISFDSPKAGFVTLGFYDMDDRLVYEEEYFAVFGQQTFSIDIAFLHKGIYFIQLDDGKIYKTNKLIIKQSFNK